MMKITDNDGTCFYELGANDVDVSKRFKELLKGDNPIVWECSICGAIFDIKETLVFANRLFCPFCFRCEA